MDEEKRSLPLWIYLVFLLVVVVAAEVVLEWLLPISSRP